MVLLVFMSLHHHLQAQSLIIELKSSGGNETEQLSDISKLYFENGTLVRDLVDGSTKSNEIASIRKVYFGDVSKTRDTNFSPLSFFPNPADQYISIAEVPTSSALLTIYNVQGKKVLVQTLNNGESTTIDISRLPAGVYFLVTESYKSKLIRL